MTLAQADLGSVPDWLAGIGAVLALIFAALAVLAGRRTNRQQAHQIQALADEKLRLQASATAAWHETRENQVRIRVRNSSTLPVFDCWAWTATIVLAEDREQIVDVRAWPFSVVPPDTTVESPEFDQYGNQGNNLIRQASMLAFTDCNTQCWIRDFRGRLHKVSRQQQEKVALELSHAGSRITIDSALSDHLLAMHDGDGTRFSPFNP